MLYVTCPNPSCPRKSLRVRPEDVQTARAGRALRVRCRRCRTRFVLRPEEVREGPPEPPPGSKWPLWNRMASLLTDTVRWPEEPGVSDVVPAEGDGTSALPSTGQADPQATTDHVPPAVPPTAAMPHGMDGVVDTPRPSGARGRKPDAEPVPQWIGRFEVHACLGEGGFGKVYRCYDTQLERPVALKVPHRGMFETPQHRQRFLNEARAAARLRHPHIVPIYEVGPDNDRPYIAFAYIEGSTLAQARDDGRLGLRRAVAIVRDLAEALAYAHRLGIIHRDVKPANVLLDSNDSCHLADFGLASRHDAAEAGRDPAEQPRLISGTPLYMSPEQWSGLPGAVREASDQYNLGVLFYELLCGHPPFEGPLKLLKYNHEKRPPDAPRSSSPAVPRDLEAVCLKTLAKNPQERYRDCQELADDLRRWLEGEPVKARPMGPGERLLRWCRREPALASALAFALVFLLAFALTMFTSAARDRKHAADMGVQSQATLAAKEVADTEAEKARKSARAAWRSDASSRIDQALSKCESGEVGQGLVRLADARGLALQAGADDLVRVIDYNLGAWRRQLHKIRVRLPHADTVTTAVYGKGGRIVATASGQEVWIWDAATGKPLHTLTAEKRVTALAFGGPEASLLLVAGSHRLDLWDLAKAPAFLTFRHTHETEPILTAGLSPDGRTVLMGGGTEGRKDGWARLWTVGQKQSRSLPGLKDPIYAVAFSRDGTQCLTGGGTRFAGTAQVWDAHSGRALGQPLKHSRGVWAAAFSPDGTEVLTGTRGLFEGEAQLWDVAGGQRKGAPLVSRLEIFGVAFSPDGSQAAIGGQDRAVTLWDVRSRQQIGSPMRHARDVNSVAFSPDGGGLLTASDDNTACLWQLSTGLVPVHVCRHLGKVLTAACSPEESRFCAGTATVDLTGNGQGGLSGQAQVWDWKSGVPWDLLSHQTPVSAVAWQPGGSKLLTGCWDGTVSVWKLDPLRRPEVLWKIAPHRPRGRPDDWVQTLAFSPDGERFAVGWRDGWVEVHTSTGPALPLKTVEAHKARLYGLAFSPNNRHFVTASQDRTVQQWDAQTGERVGKPMEHPDAVLAVVYSPGGEEILSGYAGGARRWRAEDSTPLGAPFPHQAGVFGVALCPDLFQHGPVILTGGTDGIARLWDVATGKPLGPAFAHGGAVLAASFCKKSRVLTAGLNGEARVWPLARPVQGSQERITPWVEVITGIELRKDGTIGILDPADWKQRQQTLKQAGGLPAIEKDLDQEAAERPEPDIPPSQPNPHLLVQEPAPAPEVKPAPRPAAQLTAVALAEINVSRIRTWLAGKPKLPDSVRQLEAWLQTQVAGLHPLLQKMGDKVLPRIERITLAVSGTREKPQIVAFLRGDFERKALEALLSEHARNAQDLHIDREGGRIVYVFQLHQEQALAAFADERTVVLASGRAALDAALEAGEAGITLKYKDFTLPRQPLKEKEALVLTVLPTEEMKEVLELLPGDLKDAAGRLRALTLTIDLPETALGVSLALQAQDRRTAEGMKDLLLQLRQAQGKDWARVNPDLGKAINDGKLSVEGSTALLRFELAKKVIGAFLP